MYKKKTVAVVIPAYNEEKLLGRVITTMPDFVDRMVIVDDASTDGTYQVALEYQKKEPGRIVVIRHEKNSGVGGSIADGYIWCRDNNMDMAAVMAGDAQMDPNDLVGLILPIYEDRADYTKGNRLFTGDAWQVIPFMMIILLSGMQGLQPEMAEAGRVFGGNRWQVLRKITVPMLKQTIITAMILRIIAAIQIWLIIVMIFGFNRLPVLMEQIVLNIDQYMAEEFFRKGMALSVIVAVLVSSVSFIYLKVSGAFDEPGSPEVDE